MFKCSLSDIIAFFALSVSVVTLWLSLETNKQNMTFQENQRVKVEVFQKKLSENVLSQAAYGEQLIRFYSIKNRLDDGIRTGIESACLDVYEEREFSGRHIETALIDKLNVISITATLAEKTINTAPYFSVINQDKVSNQRKLAAGMYSKDQKQNFLVDLYTEYFALRAAVIILNNELTLRTPNITLDKTPLEMYDLFFRSFDTHAYKQKVFPHIDCRVAFKAAWLDGRKTLLRIEDDFSINRRDENLSEAGPST